VRSPWYTEHRDRKTIKEEQAMSMTSYESNIIALFFMNSGSYGTQQSQRTNSHTPPPPPRPPYGENFGDSDDSNFHFRPPMADRNRDFSMGFRPDDILGRWGDCGREGREMGRGDEGRCGERRPFDEDRGREGKADNYSFDITGDPHYSVKGSLDGNQVNTSFDNQEIGKKTQMEADGYKLDTTTEKWGGNGNASVIKQASVTTGHGRDSDKVTVDANGNLSINGRSTTLENGKSLDLNRSSSIFRNTDGSYKVNSQSGNGSISTTLSSVANSSGNYMNVHVDANNVRSDGFVEHQAEKKAGK
jgi:hypothetical protein